MTSATHTLTTWLLEALAEDEAVAREHVEQRPVAGYYGPNYISGDWIPELHGKILVHPDGDNLCVEPSRVLATVAAHRRIVELHEGSAMCGTCSGAGYDPNDGERAPCRTLRAIASIYAGREGWREKWAL